ncbi:MAG: tRNA (N6-isopentenyl adenosine(37)-C2)-methylthiotransferase MiaB [Sphaerochaeta sp.]|jgi:tRNA-2-methylthio-N6-dimethylallyladenosine synthase|nr:tRNA (N6-isopentenyl adenosine(37)-C2)-methylthiotransferase MiaB [Sphaerochaeta sp.]
MKKYWLETYGCQMNIAESNALELQLKGAGMVPASRADEADCAILNTCTVRKSADNRIWGRLGEFSRIKRSHPLTLIVTGCMAERLQEDLKDDAPQVDYVIGTNDKQRIVNILTSADGKLDEVSQAYEFTESYHQEGEFSSYLPIMNGCNNFCSYCIVPYVRGREVSRSVNDILAELAYLDSKGVREVTLLGQNVNSYHYIQADGTVVTFPELLRRICRVENSIKWIRFDSPHPKDFSRDLITVIRDEVKVAKHLHIPMQSGSSRILGLMNRRYDRERFISLIDEIRSEIPSVTFATDVMVGFPTETEEEYHETLSLLDHMGCIEAFMYYFNPREGTRAEKMDGQVDEAERGRRLSQLIDFQHAIFAREKEKRITEVVEVVVTQVSKHDEAMMLGRSEHNEMIAFPCDLAPGSIVTVSLNGLKGNTYTASMVQ